MGTLLQDLRYGFRVLLKNPGLTAVAILTLALGIGANSAIFSVVNAVVLRPLPYPDPHQLVRVFSQFPTMNFMEFWTSAPEYLEFRERNEFFQDMGGYRVSGVNLTGDGEPLRIVSCSATASVFTTLRAEAQKGRPFLPEEDGASTSTDPVIVLSHSLWSQKFASDPDIVGKENQIDDRNTRVVGVMPPTFNFPDNDVQAWRPMGIDPANPGGRASHFLNLVGRLKPGVTIEQAQAQLQGLLAGWSGGASGHYPGLEGHPFILVDMHEKTVGDVRPAMLVLMAAVAFVLLIACVNVANLLLARAEVRQREIAVRTALGAERRRLIRQLLTESSLMAVIGGVVGMMLGNWGVGALLSVNPDSVPRTTEIGLDWSVLGFTLGISIVTGLVFGMVPALQLLGSQLHDTLKDGGRGVSSGRQGFRRFLVTSEVAVAVVLVICSGLMIRSFLALQSIRTGFDSENKLTMRTVLPRNAFQDNLQFVNFFRDMENRVAGVPGVKSVGMVRTLPLRSSLNANDFEIQGWVRTEDSPPVNVDYQQAITPGYLRTMGIPVMMGRDISDQDREGAAGVALVSESFVKRFWPNENPLGKQVRNCCGDPIPWLEVVGVVGDVRQGGLTEEFKPHMYVAMAQVPESFNFASRSMDLVIQADRDALALSNSVRQAIWTLRAGLPISDVQTMEGIVENSLSEPRFTVLLLSIFGTTALMLAAIGIYGVMSYSVSRRTQEIGVRMALGARGGDVVRLMVGQGMILAVIGLAVGLGGAFWMSRLLQDLLYQISNTDLGTYVGVAFTLGLVALIACYLPARRATRVDPVTALHYE